MTTALEEITQPCICLMSEQGVLVWVFPDCRITTLDMDTATHAGRMAAAQQATRLGLWSGDLDDLTEHLRGLAGETCLLLPLPSLPPLLDREPPDDLLAP